MVRWYGKGSGPGNGIQPEPPEGVLTPREQGEDGLLRDLLRLFGTSPVRSVGARTSLDEREELQVEFHLRVLPGGYRNDAFALEMRLGAKRLYVVPRIRDVLERMEEGRPAYFTKNFAYDPALHRFHPADAAVLEVLMEIRRGETWGKNHTVYHSSHRNLSDERWLPVPPVYWDRLLPVLLRAPVLKFTHKAREYAGLTVEEGLPPVVFEFAERRGGGGQEAGYLLEFRGLEDITVLAAYRAAVHEGRLFKLDAGAAARLEELKVRFDPDRRLPEIPVPRERMETLLEQVLPGLMQLGDVRIAQSVADRIQRTPLKARIYLDRVRDKLLVGLEFHYGDIIVNPLEQRDGQPAGERDRLLIRDGEKEREILRLIEMNPFLRTEGGYVLEDEETEYEFLAYTVSDLEKLAAVYATSAVKVRLHPGLDAPKVKVEVDERTDWLEIKFDLEGIPESEIRGVLQSLEEKRRYHKLSNGSLLPLEGRDLEEIRAFIDEMGIRKAELGPDLLRLPSYRGLQLAESKDKAHAVKLGRSLRQMLENIRNPDNLDFPVPPTLDGVLRDYQKYGYQWLRTLAHYGFGGILADDMGLGKTVQAIALLVSQLPAIRERRQPALVVCPASLMYNWRNELRRFAPEVRTLLADGIKEERIGTLRAAEEADVLITSYPLLRRDLELYAGVTFHTLILDEAQAFKNHATQTAQAVKSVRAERRFALTGTPVENRLEELWSICDTVFPGLFPGRRGFGDLPKGTVAKRIRPFLLRRLKSDVLKELPEKIETLQTSELHDEQKKLYAAYLARLQQEALKHLDDESFGKSRIRILAGLTRLRQICCHPALFTEDYDGSSAKFEQLLELLEECRASGKRALVFSQFTGMLDLIRREMGRQGMTHFYLDGSTPAAQRTELCTRFNDGEREFFLISLKAGGTGLNLTGADTVILYDLWWNPAVEQQAADRAHRIGQKNVVQVIRLVAQGTVEDKMVEFQQRKLNLMDEVIGGDGDALSALTEQELLELLQLDESIPNRSGRI